MTAATPSDAPKWITAAAREIENLQCNAAMWEARVAAIIAKHALAHESETVKELVALRKKYRELSGHDFNMNEKPYMGI